mmetsp:Transcript_41247/g.69396  ORF Transcript_41247/g.69396 Transcript_41247/m.69396 type:complete len:317 (+) Transcript_41247:1485-2435(+)
MVGHKLALHIGHHGTSLLGSGHDLLQRVGNLVVGDLSLSTPCGQNSSLVHHVLEIRTGKTRSSTGNDLQIDVRGKNLVTGVHPQDLDSAGNIGAIHGDLPVETTRTQQGRVQHVGSVGGCKHDYAGVALETIHLSQQLIDGLLAFIVATTHACTTLTTDSVQLINENDAGSLGFGLLEQVTHTRSTNTDEQLNELRSGSGEKGHSSLTCNGLSQQGLTSTRGPRKQTALGDLSAQLRVLLGALQEIHNFLQLQLGTFHASHVLEADSGLRDFLELGLGLSEIHGSPSHASHSASTASIAGASAEDGKETQQQKPRE